MKNLWSVAFGLLCMTWAANAQIIQFSGAPSSPPPSLQYLAQQYSTPLEIWGTQLENSSYVGNALEVQRTDNDVTTNIPFSGGKDASVAAFNSACSGTTCLLKTLYGQMGVGNCVQSTKANMPQVLVHTDGKLAIQGGTGKYCQATAVGLKAATIHAFGIFYPGYVGDTTINFYTFWNYTGTNFDDARWGFLLNPNDSFAQVDIQNAFANNGTRYTQFTFGNSNLGGTSGFHVWDVLNNTGTIRFDGSALPNIPGEATAAITYPNTTGVAIGQSIVGGDSFMGKWRALALYDTARSDRDAISSFLMTDFGVVALPTTTSAGGFNYTPQYYPGWNKTHTDINNITWWQESGGYPWSMWFGQQSNPGTTTLYRFEVRPNDSDTMVNGMERSELGGLFNNLSIFVGDDFEMFAQFYLEPGPTQTGDWADIFQIHYSTGEVVGSPDLFYIGLLNEVFSFTTTADADHTIHATQPITRSNWYALRIKGHISTNRTSDTFEVWFGNNGSTLTKIVDVAPSTIWNSATGWAGFLKNGIYRGFPNTNAGNLALVVANYQFSFTPGAFSSFVTSQPTLPAP